MAEKEESMSSFVIEVVKMFLLALVIIVPVRIFLFQPFIVRGASMEPSFHERQYLIINELGYKDIRLFGDAVHIEPRKDFDRFDVAVFRAPIGKKDFYIKRVVGLPGDRVVVDGGDVTLYTAEKPDGWLLDEEYLDEGQKTNGTVDVTLTDDEYFVLGDNRGGSSDSRSFGPVKKDTVVGRVLIRAFPPNKIQFYK